jgi:hypothetical protein
MGRNSTTGAHILLSAYRSDTGWVRYGEELVSSPRRIKSLQPDDMDKPAMQIQGLMIPSSEWIAIPADTDLPHAREWIKNMRRTVPGGVTKYGDDTVLVTMEDDEVSGVLEVGELMH